MGRGNGARTVNYKEDGNTHKHTWTFGLLPISNEALKEKWGFQLNSDSDGDVIRLRAQLVAKVFSERH